VVSKTGMRKPVASFRWCEVDAALAVSPSLLGVRNERGRNWPHLCRGVDIAAADRDGVDSINTAETLLRRGLDVNMEASTERAWRAPSLWFAIGRTSPPPRNC